jgi:hypothetical protein
MLDPTTAHKEAIQRLRMIRGDHQATVRKLSTKRRKMTDAERALAIKVEQDDIAALTYALAALGHWDK